ncbi:MAG: glycosyltransferase family 4 protein [Bdellovibrionia bacterium]
MRVAILAPLFESVPPVLYGGTERVVANLCRGLTQANIEVVLFASGDSTAEGELVPVIEEAFRLKKVLVRDPHAYHFKMLEMVAKQAEDFDIIHNNNDYWMLPLARMTSTPLITTMHGRLDLVDMPEAFYGSLNSQFISISDSQRLPMSLPWIKTIYHGIDVDRFQFYPNSGGYLAFLGRISSEKRPEWAIEIAKRSGIPLKIAAKIEAGLGQEYYDAFVKPHVDNRFIEYIGEISESEKSEFLGNSLATVFPVDWPEPFGLVMIESLACGTPVLARPCGSVPELLKDGITGYCDMNIEVLADKVKNISAIDRKGCRAWVESKFSLQRMTEDYIHVYRHVAAQRAWRDRHRRDLVHPFQRPSDRDRQG